MQSYCDLVDISLALSYARHACLPDMPTEPAGRLLLAHRQAHTLLSDQRFRGVLDTMKRDLMDILACPVCKSPLELKVEKEDEQEIVSGSLFCQKCSETYPIVDSIPNLLPPQLREA